MSWLWLPEQDALLRKHRKWTDKKLAQAVSAIGPTRTPMAVQDRRRTLAKPRALTGWQLTAKERRAGWPVMKGDAETRDARYVERLAKAQTQALTALRCPCPRCLACIDWKTTLLKRETA